METTLERGSFGRWPMVNGSPVSDPDFTKAVLSLLPNSQSALYKAAPDLLEALEMAISAFNVEAIEPLVAMATIEKARAAITKAKGE